MKELDDVTIVIPSSGRSGKQTTLHQLPHDVLKHTYIAVAEKEYVDYKGWTVRGCGILSVPNKEKGISKTRKWLMENVNTRFLLMLDDDMTFAYRPDINSPTLQALEPKQLLITTMLTSWKEYAKLYIHVGLSARQGNNNSNTVLGECCRMYNAYMYDLRAVMELGPKLGRLPVMEDFDLTLQLLRMGYPNAMMYRWCWNQSGSNAKGGCSQYRTNDMQTEAAYKLAKLHAPFVKVVTKESQNWKGMETRTDVRVQWKAAYKAGLAARGAGA